MDASSQTLNALDDGLLQGVAPPLERNLERLREVSPFGGILPDEQRHEVLDEVRRAS